MELFGVHFCHEEAFVLLASLPFLGFYVNKWRAKLHAKKKCHHEKEKSDAVEA